GLHRGRQDGIRPDLRFRYEALHAQLQRVLHGDGADYESRPGGRGHAQWHPRQQRIRRPRRGSGLPRRHRRSAPAPRSPERSAGRNSSHARRQEQGRGRRRRCGRFHDRAEHPARFRRRGRYRRRSGQRSQGAELRRQDEARCVGRSRIQGPDDSARRQRHRARAVPGRRIDFTSGGAHPRTILAMTLGETLSGVPLLEPLAPELAGRELAGLDYDSRRVGEGFLFFAFSGSRVDGRQFAQDAVAHGAVAVVSESERPAEFSAPWLQVSHGRQALALASRNFYHKPDERIGLTGITGTNGKTTTGFLVDSVLRAAGHVTALIGTIEYHLAGKVLPAVNTTPESLELVRIFAELEKQGGSHATMEVSSHALALSRVYGLHFHTAAFT